jgi:ribosomal protein L11 methyltransferase
VSKTCLAKLWPALDASSDQPDLLLAAVDDFSPTAVEERDDTLRIFFASPVARDAAIAALSNRFRVSAIDVDDEDWARRSQDSLAPITVGRITIVPAVSAPPASPAQPSIVIAIPPSMGFGTGHHATTRLCLAALQTIDLRGAFVLDAGTGSGVLAIAAVALGAARALGIDDDPDAIAAATENLGVNGVTNVEFAVRDLMKDDLPTADVVVANLTGALVVRAAGRLLGAVRPGGALIISGVLASEGADVRQAFANQSLVADVQEDEWLALTIRSA